MSQKYLSLEETAALLRMPTDEVIRLREKGGLRGFADRGTWKFREDDVQQVLRSRQPDSDPDVPILVPDSAIGADDDVGEQPTVIRKPDLPKTSDSEVTLLGGSDVEIDALDSDSDVKLAGESGLALTEKNKSSVSDIKIALPDSSLHLDAPEQKPKKPAVPQLPPIDLSKFDSDSDVALVGESKPQSDSDVALVGGKTDQITIGPLDPSLGSDSDVRLVSDPRPSGSDSDVKLVEPQKNQGSGSDSDVALLSEDDQSIALDFTPDEGEGASVLSDESGIRLTGESSGLLFKSSSGVKLRQDDDESITLDIAGDSGISLDVSSDSGISLESVADSGISLEGEGFGGTIPMMDALKEDQDETAFEIPSLKDDSEFELSTGGSDDETAVFDLEEAEAGLDDGEFNVDEGASDDSELSEIADFEEDDLDVADDILGEDDELDDMDVFDADEDAFDEGVSPAGKRFAAPVGAAAPEQEWGGGIFAFLLVSTALLVVVGMVMFDLVHNIWAWNEPTQISRTLLDSLGGLYK